MNNSAWLVSLSCICLWPLLWGMVGYFIGRNKLRIQSPFVIGDRQMHPTGSPVARVPRAPTPSDSFTRPGQ